MVDVKTVDAGISQIGGLDRGTPAPDRFFCKGQALTNGCWIGCLSTDWQNHHHNIFLKV